MKTIAALCIAVLLLLLTGCQNLGEQNVQDSPSAVSAAAVPGSSLSTVEPKKTESFTAGTSTADTPATPAISPGAVTQDVIPPVLVSGSESTDSTAGQADEPAPKADVSTALDDIIKELNDLDKLYSQLDDISDADLSE